MKIFNLVLVQGIKFKIIIIFKKSHKDSPIYSQGLNNCFKKTFKTFVKNNPNTTSGNLSCNRENEVLNRKYQNAALAL